MPSLVQASRLWAPGKTEHIYGEVRYKAGKWPDLRRVIIKAEVTRAADKDPKDNPRFLITNMKQSPIWWSSSAMSVASSGFAGSHYELWFLIFNESGKKDTCPTVPVLIGRKSCSNR
jgi:hypothetical protein